MEDNNTNERLYHVDYDSNRYFAVTRNNGSGLNYCDEYRANESGWLELVRTDVGMTDRELKRLAKEIF